MAGTSASESILGGGGGMFRGVAYWDSAGSVAGDSVGSAARDAGDWDCLPNPSKKKDRDFFREVLQLCILHLPRVV